MMTKDEIIECVSRHNRKAAADIVTDRGAVRVELDRHVGEFIARGGAIKTVAPGGSAFNLTLERDVNGQLRYADVGTVGAYQSTSPYGVYADEYTRSRERANRIRRNRSTVPYKARSGTVPYTGRAEGLARGRETLRLNREARAAASKGAPDVG